MHHLTLRVAWHDQKWNATVCTSPKDNPFCLALDRVREKRNDELEASLRGQFWRDLAPDQMPPCIAESAGFMNQQEWHRRFEHPYQYNKKTAATHGVLEPTTVTIPEYATFAVPFAWMLRENQDAIQDALPQQLPPDEEAPFDSPWVFGSARQEALLDVVFGRLKDEKSLVFFYCKEGQPLGDMFSRLVVGVGRIGKVGKVIPYKSKAKKTYPLWDRIIRHSIRTGEHDGFLLPYHEYLTPTGDPAEDERRRDLLKEIAVTADGAHVRSFSYGAELATSDVALSMLVKCLDAVRRIREHKIADGPWLKREEWLNEQINEAWKDRGAFPGLGAALEAIGMRLGTALALELLSSNTIGPDDDPWPVVNELMAGTRKPPQPAYEADLGATRKTWAALSPQRRTLLMLLSRFSLSPAQAKRWFDAKARAKATQVAIPDDAIIANPYRIAEADLGDGKEPPVSVGTIDRGLLPDKAVAAKHPVPAPSAVGSPIDQRRVRAALVSVLRDAAAQGDTLLSTGEALERVSQLDLAHPCGVTSDWVEGNATFLNGTVEQIDVLAKAENDEHLAALQLTEFKDREDSLRKVLRARAAQPLPSLAQDWPALLVAAITDAGAQFDPSNPRHRSALDEQAAALEKVTTRKLSALVGRAGTGKSSALGALIRCDKLAKGGILLLAPTGKARVRLGKATGADAMTVAQFLYNLKRYDGARQRPLFAGQKHQREKTVVIDECSMLTMDDLAAILAALDLMHVDRVILVGDPNQLPPIGAGRPFADLVASLDDAASAGDPDAKAFAGALGRLTVEVRTRSGAPSDALRLASWYTREPQPVDADRVISDLQLGNPFNDLEVCFWKTPDDLRNELLRQFVKHLGLKDGNDVQGFNRAVGLDDQGYVPAFNANAAEGFQILSPVRMHAHGVYDLNRWVQRRFRSAELEKAREPWGMRLGDEEIVVHDKVINVKNKTRGAYDGSKTEDVYLANGEIGLVSGGKSPFTNVVFAGRPGLRIGYPKWEFSDGSGPLELAYVLTVHKAQGSEFNKVFLVLPENCFLLSRELLYTALTRSRDHLVLLIQGSDASKLFELSKPESSETARRNTNLFRGAVRAESDAVPYAHHLIHRTDKGHMVRSKSELVIANKLHGMGLDYYYERKFVSPLDNYPVWPDFTFADAAGNVIIWEHLGMLSRDDYREGWEWKKAWYAKNGFTLGKNLFTTQDDERGGLDSGDIQKTAEQIQKLV